MRSIRSSVVDLGRCAIGLGRRIVRTEGARWWQLERWGVGEVFLAQHFVSRAYGAGRTRVGGCVFGGGD